MKTWLAPEHQERRYARLLKKTVAEARKELLARLALVISLQRVGNDNPGSDSDQVAEAIAATLFWWQSKKEELRRNFYGYFALINVFNDTQFRLVIRSLTRISLPPTNAVGYVPGVLVSPYSDIVRTFGESADILRSEPYLEGMQKNWVASQETYIDTAVKQAVSDTELIVRNSIVTSALKNAIIDAITNKFETVEKRAESFAENQVNSLNTQLTRQRQQSLGANEYIWETRRDERVRGNPNGLYPKAKPSHFHRDNKMFNWANPPEGGHPGEAFGCRCKAVIKLAR